MISTNIQYNNANCNPTQIINVNQPIDDISKLSIYELAEKSGLATEQNGYNINNENIIDKECLMFAYSVDNVCWSCYMSYNDLLKATINLNGDFYIRFKISDAISEIKYDGNPTSFSSQLSSDFNFTECENSSANTFNPYANMDSAVNLQTTLTETVSCLFGIPIYYFKLKPNAGGKDITFKEYALMNIDSVKQIKMFITDGTMPSSKTEFADLGLEFQTDWETEISKATFATAFGNTAQPMEGDLIYIPMMKRMWMVNGSYEEKNGSLMWNATTFKVALVKYQEKGFVDLGNTQSFVDDIVKNKYDDLFGEDSNNTLDSGENNITSPEHATSNLYPIYESDALRKYITLDTIDITNDTSLYYKGTLISDSRYHFNTNSYDSKVIYQKKYCGCNVSISFIINPEIISSFKGVIAKVGNITVNIDQNMDTTQLYLNISKSNKIELISGNTYFVVIRWNQSMNLVDMSAYKYKLINDNIPLYKINKIHYFFDIDNPVGQISMPYNEMCIDSEGHDVYISNFFGSITNFKMFDVYNDNISELLQMFPTNQHLLINDTARRINGRPGVLLS